MQPDDHRHKIAAARRSLDGLSVGDAFGETFFANPSGARIASKTVAAPPWPYTDDTEMALAIVQVLDEMGSLDQDRLAHAFAARYQKRPERGYGAAAHTLLQSIGQGTAWRFATRVPFGGTGSMGNGAAMRAAPLGAYFAADSTALVEAARASAEVTHFHEDGQAGAIAVALAAAWMWTHRAHAQLPSQDVFFDFLMHHVPDGPTAEGLAKAAQLSSEAPVSEAASRLGTGQKMLSSDTVPFAIWCAYRYAHDFAEAMWATVSGLGDCDTTCAIAGGIVALTDRGRQTIPAHWLVAREPLAVGDGA